MLAPWIISNLPPHRIYVEAFGGGGSILLRKPKSYAEIYNDIDSEVVTFFRVLQDKTKAGELKRLLSSTPFAREEFNAAYEPTECDIEQSRRLIIRSFMGFGSDGCNDARKTGFRSNSNRSGTTPAHDWVNYTTQIEAFTARLSGVVIENRPAIDVIKQHDGPMTLHYVDPPYVHSTRKTSGKNYRHEMTDQDHVDLATTLRSARGAVILSGYESELYNNLYAGWHIEKRPALADGASPRTELLFINAAAMPVDLLTSKTY